MTGMGCGAGSPRLSPWGGFQNSLQLAALCSAGYLTLRADSSKWGLLGAVALGTVLGHAVVAAAAGMRRAPHPGDVAVLVSLFLGAGTATVGAAGHLLFANAQFPWLALLGSGAALWGAAALLLDIADTNRARRRGVTPQSDRSGRRLRDSRCLKRSELLPASGARRDRPRPLTTRWQRALPGAAPPSPW